MGSRRYDLPYAVTVRRKERKALLTSNPPLSSPDSQGDGRIWIPSRDGTAENHDLGTDTVCYQATGRPHWPFTLAGSHHIGCVNGGETRQPGSKSHSSSDSCPFCSSFFFGFAGLLYEFEGCAPPRHSSHSIIQEEAQFH